VTAEETVAPGRAAPGPAALTCREFVELLYDYLLGGLGAQGTTVMNAHLAACPSCVAYLKTYEASIRMGRLALAPSDDPVPAEVPEALVRAVLAARRGRDTPPGAP
jgi:anti-sigma factor RsiW